MKDIIKTASVKFKNYEEFYITIKRGFISKEIAKKIISDLKKRKISILGVVFSGNLAASKKCASLFESYPKILLGDFLKSKNKKEKADTFGICIHALKSHGKVEYIKDSNKIIGSCLKIKDLNFLLLAGLENKNTNIASFDDQALDNYQKIEATLKKSGFNFHDIYRFWNFMEDIPANYMSFNKIRDNIFNKHRVCNYPAATGIEASLPGREKINISLEALKNTVHVDVERLSSHVQCESSVYGPKFSRAVVLNFKREGIKKMYISGTSSVDKKGNSIFQKDYKNNVAYVTDCVNHLLIKGDMSFEKILTAYIYSKNEKILKEFQKLYTLKKWKFPYNYMITNICRDNFLFEMECIAANIAKTEIKSGSYGNK